jgi:hypothetical protein
MQCALEGWYDVPCGQSFHQHHLISRHKVRGNKKARAYIESMPHIFKEWICNVHNCDKWADTRKARAYLFQQKIDMLKSDGIKHAEGIIEGAIDMIPWKTPHHELSFAGIMSVEIAT